MLDYEEEMGNPIGVDVSKYQGEQGAPIPGLVRNGAEFVWIRASIGTQRDIALDENARAVIDAKVPYGFYHFGWPQLTAQDQAIAFWDAVKDYVRPITGLAFDAERGRAAERSDNFSRELRQLHGQDRQHTLYTGEYYWRRLHRNPDATPDYDALWLAFYTETHQRLDQNVDTSSVSFRAHGLAGFARRDAVQFGPLVYNRHRYDGNVLSFTIDKWRKVFGDGDPTPQRPPIEERPRYLHGYNALIDAATAAVQGLNVPDPGSGPAWEAGVEAARQDVLDDLANLHIAEGN